MYKIIILAFSMGSILHASSLLCSYSNGKTISKGFFRDTIVDKQYYPIKIESNGKILTITNNNKKLQLNNPIKRIIDPAISTIELQFHHPKESTSYYLTVREYYDDSKGMINYAESVRIYKDTQKEKVNLTYICGDTNQQLY